MWSSINKIRGTNNTKPNANYNNIDAHSLNKHFASTSTDNSYTKPPLKHTTISNEHHLNSMTIYYLLTKHCPTGTGSDGLPPWYLQLIAPVISKPLSTIYNKCINYSFFPTQWKSSIIHPIPKTKHPSSASEFRPISITPILSRLLEKFIMRQYIYPCFDHPSVKPDLMDQFAFRPTGSPTAAITYLTTVVTSLLRTNSHVHLIALDFSKAFDTLNHFTLANNLASLPLPDNIYNLLISFLSNRSHSTIHNNKLSSILPINSSVVQGSVLGPSTFIINASTLKPKHQQNNIVKFADDTYLIIPSSNANTIQSELDSLSTWAKLSNLSLNLNKSFELIVHNNHKPIIPPSEHPSIHRTDSLTILGVTFTSTLNVSPHIENLLTKSFQTFYALKTIRSHGLFGVRLHDITESLIISRLKYAAPSWSGFINQQQLKQLQSLLNKLIRLNYLPISYPPISTIFHTLDSRLFLKVTTNPHHVLHQILPPKKKATHNLRQRKHNYDIPQYSTYQNKTFIPRHLNYITSN